MIKPGRRQIEQIKPYTPGKPVEELERELGIREAMKLASNENPLGPSPRAVKAVARSLAAVNRYPDGGAFLLRGALAKRLKVKPESLVFGNGSNELIELLVRTYLKPGEAAVTSECSFLVYDLVVPAAGGRLRKVPMKKFTFDLEGIGSHVDRKTRMVFIANPNNPTGTMVREHELVRFLRRIPGDVLVAMDEAYAEFATDPRYPRSLRLLARFPNLVILRTFSKIYGLAGLRIGYGVARPEVADYLNRVRQPFNVNSLAQEAARAALEDVAHVRATRANNRRGFALLYREFRRMRIPYVPSQANFVLFRVPGNGSEYYQHLLRAGVIVRPMAGYGLPDWLRVSIGLPRENRKFLAALRQALAQLPAPSRKGRRSHAG